MALGDPYATAAELKTRFGITDVIDDVDLAEALDAASRSVERYCRRQFNDAGAVSPRSFRPVHGRLVLVDDFSTDTGLVVETDDDNDATFETVWSASAYQLEPLDGVVDGDPGWPFWRVRAVDSQRFPRLHRASVQVTAQWGWTAVPDPVRDVTLQLAAELFKLKDAPFGVAGFGDFGAVRVRENPKFKGMLGPYRRDPVPVA